MQLLRATFLQGHWELSTFNWDKDVFPPHSPPLLSKFMSAHLVSQIQTPKRCFSLGFAIFRIIIPSGLDLSQTHWP